MKNRKLSGIIIFVICISLLVGVFYYFTKEDEIKQGVAVLKQSNIKELEPDFGKLPQYINKEDDKLSVKDITENDLNNYKDDEHTLERLYRYSGMLPLLKKEEIPFGAAYRIPVIVLKAGSNVLLSDIKGNSWEVKENAVKVTYTFDIVSNIDL